MQILSNAATADRTQWKHQQLGHTWRKLLSDLVPWCTDSTQIHQDNSLGQDLPEREREREIRIKMLAFATRGIFYNLESLKISATTHCLDWGWISLLVYTSITIKPTDTQAPFHRNTLHFSCTNYSENTQSYCTWSLLSRESGWLMTIDTEKGLDHIFVLVITCPLTLAWSTLLSVNWDSQQLKSSRIGCSHLIKRTSRQLLTKYFSSPAFLK